MSLQSCLTLCDPIDGSSPGSAIPGILQARTLEWVAISFSNAWKWKVKMKSLSRVWLCDPMDCSLPGSSIHGIFQARVLEWVGIAFSIIYFNWRLITLQYFYGFCHTFTWISHGYTCVPHPELPSHLPPHHIPQGHPSAAALSTLSHASNLDWWSISHMIIYMFQCYSLKSSHPHLLPQSPKDCSLHLCFFCCLAYRVIVTIFLNFIYMF